MYYEYVSPPLWLNAHIQDPRITVERLLRLRWWDWESSKIAANLDLLYANPDDWSQELQLKESQGIDGLKFIE